MREPPRVRTRASWPTLASAVTLLAALLLVPLVLATRADAFVDGADGFSNTSGRATLDGTGVERSFIDQPYVALGDSVAAFGPSYVQKLFPYYQSTLGVTQLSNRSRGGETSGSLRTGGQLALALADINAASDTRVVTIDIGGNDGLQGCDFTSPGCPFRANFSATLADLQTGLANDPGAEPLIALAYYNPDVGEPGEAMRDHQLLGASVKLNCADTGAELGLNDIIAQEAEAHAALLADAYPAFKAAGQAFMADAVHPNDAGQAAIAEAFREARAPCEALPVGAPPVVTPPPPSNSLDFGGLLRNVAKGTAMLTVRVPGPGDLLLERTKRLRADSKQAAAAGEVRLRVRSRRKAKTTLMRTGKVKVKAVVTFTPTGGEPNTKSKRVKLKQRVR